ncbi:MAG TPA: hypothetical protein VM869_10900 [Enhygromyxa sp.]|nr:hypothetical protein [Enhygromyxa sp.]
MRRASILAGAALTWLSAGCDADVDQGEAASAWVEVVATKFASDGESEVVMVPAQGSAAALALRVSTDPGVCFQLSTLVDGDGEALVEQRSPGPFCRDCGLRSSVALESGVFVLPAETVALASGVSLRFARVECQTLTPLTPSDAGDRPSLRIDAQAIAAEPERATIDLRFLIAADSILAGDPARQQAIVAALADELASAGLSPRLVAVVDLDAAAEEVRFHAGDHAALAALLRDAPARAEQTIDVVFGGCLLYDDPIFGPPRPVEGYTPRIPGGAGPADGVFMPGLDCFAAAAGPADIPVESQAHVLAHELGHYLGLYHAVEADGLGDPLADTDANNLMHFRPGLATSVGLSPAQGRVMRTHPAARPE